MRRLVVVAESSLIVEAIALGLRSSGDFELVGPIEPERLSVQSVVQSVAAQAPDAILIDELDDRARMLELTEQLAGAHRQAAVIVLTLSPEPGWLDQLFAAGAGSAISKATQPAALATLIRETLDRRVINLHRPLGSAAREARAGGQGPLSPRELEVLQLVAGGSTNGEIARRLWVTEQTVKFHLSNIYRKLGVGNRTEASRYAHLHGILGGEPPPTV